MVHWNQWSFNILNFKASLKEQEVGSKQFMLHMSGKTRRILANQKARNCGCRARNTRASVVPLLVWASTRSLSLGLVSAVSGSGL